MTDPKQELERLLGEIRGLASPPPSAQEEERPAVSGKPRVEVFSFALSEETGADIAKTINDRIDALIEAGGNGFQPTIHVEGGRLVIVLFYVSQG